MTVEAGRCSGSGGTRCHESAGQHLRGPTQLDLHAQLLLLVQVVRRGLHPGSCVDAMLWFYYVEF
jgi:hypothetical protein